MMTCLPIKSALLCLALLLITLGSDPPLSFSAPRLIDDFQAGINSGWKVKEFKGKTSYKTHAEDGVVCLKAEAKDSASGLFYKIEYDPKQVQILSWKWKVDNTIENGDARTKAGDDFAARIYVVFPSVFFWRTKALNYIWANKLPLGESLPSSYTKNDILIAVESGPSNTGKWREYRRNIYQDYIKYFGEEPGMVGAIAVMTDTDNTSSSASACYGPIFIDSAIENSSNER